MKQDKIKVIFFDLDDTLFDYSACSTRAKEEAFRYLLEKHPNLKRKVVVQCYCAIITEAVKGETRGSYIGWDRLTRFSNLIARLGLSNSELPQKLARIYTEAKERSLSPFPQTHKVLKRLKRKYSLGLITNGPSEYQRDMILSLGLLQYFQHILISEEVECQKPEIEIFQLALRKADCKASEAVMVGDSLSYDILPARKIGMQTVLLDSCRKYIKDIPIHEKPDYIIYDISELTEIY